MYTKVFRSIYDGTLADDWRALVTFQQLLILANQDGVVDMTLSAIARTTGIPIEILQAGIKALESPDPASRTPDMDGRRICRLDEHRDWGWFLVNFAKYRKMQSLEQKREADRDRVARKRRIARDVSQPVASSRDLSQVVAGCRDVSQPVASSRDLSQVVAGCRDVSQPVANVAHTYTYTDIEASIPDGMDVVGAQDVPAEPTTKAAPIDRTPHEAIVEAYHDELPMLPRVREWGNARRALLRSRWREDRERQSVDWWRGFFAYVRDCPFLVGQGASNGREPFFADLEWLVTPKNFRRVIEGRYERRGA